QSNAPGKIVSPDGATYVTSGASFCYIHDILAGWLGGARVCGDSDQLNLIPIPIPSDSTWCIEPVQLLGGPSDQLPGSHLLGGGRFAAPGVEATGHGA